MLKNYLVISIRNIWKHKLYSFINIFSLTFGLAASIVIYLFIQDELSFDAFNTKHDSLYRLNEVQSFPGTNTQHVALSMPGMAPNMIEEFPEIQNYTRFYSRGRKLYNTEDMEVIIDKSVFVDSTFFQMFDFELARGDRSTALHQPYSVIFTQESAEKLFGTIEGIVGESVTMDGDMYIVKGVLENLSENSHLQFDYLVLPLLPLSAELRR